jgi:hypothetical protein
MSILALASKTGRPDHQAKVVFGGWTAASEIASFKFGQRLLAA